ncbi:MAG: hypothetical protein ACM3PE_02480 [Deltaproteobacteria bacterium]
MLMRKNFPILLLLVAIILFTSAGPLTAAQAPAWQLTVRDDGTIAERVTLAAGSELKSTEWQITSADGQLTAERTTKNWPAYMKLKDRLPLQFEKKNYILWQDIDIKKNSAITLQGLAATVLADNNSKISLRVPGVVNQSAGTQLAEDQAELTGSVIGQLGDGASLLQATTFNGLMLGIILFVLGFLVVVIVFMNRIRKVNRMIEEEYSLEKAHEQLELEEKEQREQQEKQEQNQAENKEDE